MGPASSGPWDSGLEIANTQVCSRTMLTENTQLLLFLIMRVRTGLFPDLSKTFLPELKELLNHSVY